MPTVVALPDTGAVIGGKYALTRVIGEGGMGMVYEATHLKLRQRVALKLLLPDLLARPDVVARFEREARAALSLSGEHVARVLDVDVLPDGLPYMVMEYLEGRDLAAELAARGPLPVHEAVGYVLQACEAMTIAHRAGTVHRDLKPGNLFLAAQGEGRVVIKVIDFGISKIADEDGISVTATFSALGTAPYMSPEQVRSAKNADARSDIWSLGVILHELITGKPPFEGENVPTVVAAIIADPPKPLRAARPDAPAGLEAAILRCLEKDRERRFADVEELAAAIAPYVDPNARFDESLAAAAVEAPSAPVETPKRRSGAKVAVGLLVAAGAVGALLLSRGPAPEAPVVAPAAIIAPPVVAAPPPPPAAPAPAPEAAIAVPEPLPTKPAVARSRKHAAKKILPKTRSKPASPARSKVDLPDSPG
jgi:serine/threonine-protein kinase